jgi:hypothetical protein
MSEIFLKYTFNAKDEGDMYEYGNLVRANQYRRLLSEIFREFRNKSKHGQPAGDHGTWDKSYKLLWKLAEEEGIDPWEEIF